MPPLWQAEETASYQTLNPIDFENPPSVTHKEGWFLRPRIDVAGQSATGGSPLCGPALAIFRLANPGALCKCSTSLPERAAQTCVRCAGWPERRR